MISETVLPKLSLLAPFECGSGVWANMVDLDREKTSMAPFNAARFTVEPGCSSIVDSHPMHEIWMIAAGGGVLTYDEQEVRVVCSDVLYFEPPKPHFVTNDGAEQMVVFSIWWNN
jgi:quercetin dioxygenase-like cupin family protein